MEAPFFANKASCCFTGHRPKGLPAENSGGMASLKLLLIRTVREAAAAGVGVFLCGGAEGFDTFAAEAVLAVREEFPALRLVLALPGRDFIAGRAPRERMRAEAILRAADEIVYAGETGHFALAMRTRNRYLVDHADCCVSYLRHSRGGTLYTANYALSRGIPVRNLAKELPL